MDKENIKIIYSWKKSLFLEEEEGKVIIFYIIDFKKLNSLNSFIDFNEPDPKKQE